MPKRATAECSWFSVVKTQFNQRGDSFSIFRSRSLSHSIMGNRRDTSRLFLDKDLFILKVARQYSDRKLRPSGEVGLGSWF